MRLRVNRKDPIKDGSDQIGNRTEVKVLKNKIAPPFRDIEFDLIYGKGISRTGELMDMAVDKKIIQKTGSWFTVGEERLQGRDKVLAYLEENPLALFQIDQQVKEALSLKTEGESKTRESKFPEAKPLDIESAPLLPEQIEQNGHVEPPIAA